MPQQDTHLLDFKSYLKKEHPHYIIDQVNSKIIDDLGLWANRNPMFNSRPATVNGQKSNWHIDRGITIIGPVGVGKDDIIRYLRRYLAYLRSPYCYSFKVVWKFASEFSKEKVGYNAFREEAEGNRYYEELCLTDEDSGIPTREYGLHFGKKVLVGSELIKLRYDAWKGFGWISLFSTNVNEDILEQVYGTRGYSRLKEMTNIMFMAGPNRRYTIAPVIINNRNNPTAPKENPVTAAEINENRQKLNDDYKRFVRESVLSETAAFDYNLLVVNGVEVATEPELRMLMDLVGRTYTPDAKVTTKTTREREEARNAYVWEQTRKRAVMNFYMKLKAAGATTIFDEVDFTYRIFNKSVSEKPVGEILESATRTRKPSTEESKHPWQ